MSALEKDWVIPDIKPPANYPRSPGQDKVSDELVVSNVSFMQRRVNDYKNLIEGEIVLKDITITAKELTNSSLVPNLRLLMYFCGTPSSVLDVDLHCIDGKIEEFHHREVVDNSGYNVYVLSGGEKVLIGSIQADLVGEKCTCCNGLSIPPILMIKTTTYQQDGSDKLLGAQWVNVFGEEGEQTKIELFHVSLSVFVFQAQELMVTMMMDVETKIDRSKLVFKDIHYKRLINTLDNNTLMRRREDIMNDRPFHVYDKGDEGLLTGFIATDTCIVAKSLYYLTVGKYITVTFNWCYMLLDYHFRIYDMELTKWYDKMKQTFGFDNESEWENKILTHPRIGDPSYQHLWNSTIHVLINALTVFVSVSNNYSLDKEEIVCTDGDRVAIAEQDNERNTTYCMLVERTYDCEDGAGLVVILWHRVKDVLFESSVPIFRLLSFMMEQYEPFISVARTSQMSFTDRDKETFAHMGAVLLPKTYLNEVFYSCEPTDKNNMTKIPYTKDKRVYLDYKKTCPFIMESTISVMSSPFNSYMAKPLTQHDLDNYKVFNDMVTRMLCVPLSNNIEVNGNHLGDIYERIYCLHPLSINSMGRLVGTIYIDYDGKGDISFRKLYESFTTPDDVKLYFKYEASLTAYKETSDIMKLISPMICLDSNRNRYIELRDKYMKGLKMDHPFYHKFTKGVPDGVTTVPYFPVYMTNNDMEEGHVQLCLKTNHEHHLGDMFKPFL